MHEAVLKFLKKLTDYASPSPALSMVEITVLLAWGNDAKVFCQSTKTL